MSKPNTSKANEKQVNMIRTTNLTKEWQPFDGEYEKEMQDIKLKTGEIVTMCWPNADTWMVCEKQKSGRMYNKPIPSWQVAEVRLTHSKRW